MTSLIRSVICLTGLITFSYGINTPPTITPPKAASISENSFLNKRIIAIKASDKETAQDKLKYMIISGNEDNKMGFQDIAIVNVAALDRETKDTYSLKIAVIDDGTPPLSSTVMAIITVTDANEDPTCIPPPQLVIRIPENEAAGYPITHVEAVDHDLGKNAEMEFVIAKPKDLFQIHQENNTSAFITTKVSFDREQVINHNVRVEVFDKGDQPKMCHLALTVKIDDVNEPPMFQTNFSVEIPEDAAIPYNTKQVTATDVDSGNNGELEYSIASDESGIFTVDKTSGLLQVTTSGLDREKVSSYTLIITVADSGKPPLSSSTFVEVTVLDVNDNKPIFSQTSYDININGAVIKVVKATDEDSGDNGVIDYSIDGSLLQGRTAMNVFTINSQNGDITFTGDVNKPPAEKLIFNVGAKDRGTPTQEAFAKVTVTFNPQTNNPPLFAYEFSVEENTKTSFKVGRIIANDTDAGKNGQLSYSFGEVIEGSDVLSVDSGSGDILIKASPDREVRDRHRIKLTCTDGGSPPLTAQTVVVLTVTDVNDNPPLFTQQMYTTNISSNTAVNDEVLTLSASDADIGVNAEVQYSISSMGNAGADQFDISATGVITVSKVLDPASFPKVSFKVVATDKGQPPQSSEVAVEVSIIASNSPPKFNQSLYTFTVLASYLLLTQIRD